ncbi:MAG: hypothetical protein CMJ31_05195 [Phycisphaerae bacterium]|nr:hypothetical protein [Phycisphaerae bacterium]
MTTLPSFIPAVRLADAARTRRRARWGAALAAMGVMTLAVCIPAAYQTGARYLTLGEEARSLQAKIAELEDTADAAAASATMWQSRLSVVQSLTSHPDWSLLFPVLADAIGDRATLISLGLQPLARSDHPGYTLRIRGVAPSAREVSETALAIESSPLFVTVDVGSSHRSGGVVEFDMSCAIAPRPVGEVPNATSTGGTP